LIFRIPIHISNGIIQPRPDVLRLKAQLALSTGYAGTIYFMILLARLFD